MNNLDIVLALFTTPNYRFSRLDTTVAFQAATSVTSNWVQQNSSQPLPWIPEPSTVNNKLKRREGSGSTGRFFD
jgi:hypothetical protein